MSINHDLLNIMINDLRDYTCEHLLMKTRCLLGKEGPSDLLDGFSNFQKKHPELSKEICELRFVQDRLAFLLEGGPAPDDEYCYPLWLLVTEIMRARCAHKDLPFPTHYRYEDPDAMYIKIYDARQARARKALTPKQPDPSIPMK